MADEVVDAAVEAPVDTPVGNIPVDAPVTPAETPQADEFTPLEDLFKDIGKEDPAADPPAQQDPAAIPPQFESALKISQYVTSPEQLSNAVQAADEVWKVAQGQLPAYSMLEAVRQHDPARHQAMVGELTQYIEQITGQKFGQGQQLDPVAQLRQELQQRDVKAQQERQQQEFQQHVQKASAVTSEKAAALLKGSILEGEHEYIISQAHRFSKVSPEQLLKEVVSGNTKNLEDALKAAQKHEEKRLADVNKKIIANHRAKKGALPASRTNPGTPVTQAGDKPDLSTPESRIKWATEQFKARTV